LCTAWRTGTGTSAGPEEKQETEALQRYEDPSPHFVTLRDLRLNGCSSFESPSIASGEKDTYKKDQFAWSFLIAGSAFYGGLFCVRT
jgi:hypothetical protein